MNEETSIDERDGASAHTSSSSFEHGSAEHSVKEGVTTTFLVVLTSFATIGGLLFGYDTGIVSGALLFIKKTFELTTEWQELIVSGTVGAAAVFSFVSIPMNKQFGRKPTIMAGSVTFVVGSVFMGVAWDKYVLLVGRIIVGAAIGMTSSTVPMYVAECSPARYRGRLVTIYQLFITIGVFLSSVLAAAFSYLPDTGWRYMLGLAGVPAVVQFVGFFYLPESPRWLVDNGKEAQARAVLIRARGHENVDQELLQIRESCHEARKEQSLRGNQFVIVKMIRTPAVRRALIVGCGLQMIAQFSAINTIIYYSATILQMAGIRDKTQAIWLVALTSAVNFVFTFLGLWLVERIGRKPLALGSLIGILISLIVLAVGFQLEDIYSPSVDFRENITSSCQDFRFCESCTRSRSCGYCFVESTMSNSINGSCLPSNENSDTKSLFGRCNSTTMDSHDLVWAYNYCPTPYYWIAILGLILFLMCFSPGMGPMPWTINSEIYPLWARSTGNALATATNWICNLIVSISFLSLTESITKYGTYWMYASIAVLGIVFIAALLPETKGKSLEQVEELFSVEFSLLPSKKKKDYSKL